MEAPDKIYVPQHNIEAGNIQELGELIVAGSTEYIRKDAILEWLNRMLGISAQAFEFQRSNAYRRVIEKLNSM